MDVRKKVLIFGCNAKTEFIVPRLMGVGTISEIILASKDRAECDRIRDKYSGKGPRITTARVDLDNEQGTKMMLSITNPEVIVSMAAAERNLIIMKLALGIGADYIDGNLCNWKNGDLLSDQFKLFADFRSAGKMAVTGCAMNPAVLATLVKAAVRDDFDNVESALILEDNLEADPITSEDAVMIKDGTGKTYPARSESIEHGGKTMYLVNSAVTQDFLKEIPGVPNVGCYVSFEEAEEEVDYISVLDKLGVLTDDLIEVAPGVSISSRQFWNKFAASKKTVKELSGACMTGVVISGTRRSTPLCEYIYTTGDNDTCMREYGMSFRMLLDSYALLSGIILICSGKWLKSGVFTPAAFDPDLLITALRTHGLVIKKEEIPSV